MAYGKFDWLQQVADYADRRDIVFQVWRDEIRDWLVTFTFGDTYGLYHSDPIPLPNQCGKSVLGETLEKKLDKFCTDAHSRRRLENMSRVERRMKEIGVVL